MITLEGSFPALITPMKINNNQDVNFDVLHKLVQMHIHAGSSGIVPCGTTGEGPTLSHEEHNKIIRECVNVATGTGLLVIPGTGSNSTKEAMQLTEHAAKVKADACLVVAPYYNKPTADGVVTHFRHLNTVGIPLIVYNIPGRSGINIEPMTLLEIASECKNIVAIKASNGNLDEILQTTNLFRQNKINVQILSGDDSLTLPILAAGGTGVISVLANIWPNTMAMLIHLYRTQANNTKAMTLAQIIHPLCLALLRFGANPSPIKALMGVQGFSVGGTRLPITVLGKPELQELMSLFEKVRSYLIENDLWTETPLS